MDTYVLSDLHLSAAKEGGLYAGGDALLHLISRLAQKATPARVILNGDTFDFLAEEGELAH
jgi:metallophosphoesterase superfamily enzyme